MMYACDHDAEHPYEDACRAEEDVSFGVVAYHDVFIYLYSTNITNVCDTGKCFGFYFTTGRKILL
jgi:hypothetical protein